MARGRPTVFTPERIKKLVELLANGVPPMTACPIAGICHQSYKLRRKRGKEKQDQESIDFYQATQKAIAEHEAKLVLVLEQAAMSSKDAKMSCESAKFLLERRYWQRWSPHHKSELTGKNGGPIAIDTDVSQMTDDELREIAAGLAVGSTRKG